MFNKLTLSKQKYRDLNRILERFSSKSNQQITLDELIKKWINFVGSVERGYDDSIYEYTNDLSVRNILEEIIVSTNESTREKIKNVLLPWDERFIKATRPTEKQLRWQKPEYVWSQRLPLILKGELLEDLKAEGLV